MKVLSVTSEIYPLVKTGGLADVAGALPVALAGQGVEVTSFVPGYPAVTQALTKAKTVRQGPDWRILSGRADGLDLMVFDAPDLFDRDGGPYGKDGADWPDNARRFARFARAAAEVARDGFDLLHAHDWQAALAPVHLALDGGPPSLLTIHNIAFQGRYGRDVLDELALPEGAFSVEGVEYWGDVGFLKGGLSLASAITTVSPTYAKEIRTPEFGMGMEGIINARAHVLHGIVNGIDTEAWNPADDPALVKGFSPRTLARRRANREALDDRFGLQPGGPLFCVISRLTSQKGLDLLAQNVDHLVGLGGRLAVLGSGEPGLEQAFAHAADRHPGRVAIHVGYDEPLSHLMQGGADAILIPSRFEPCGLTQLYGLRYGCVPIVARTGGLADTVVHANDAALRAGVATGIVHAPGDGFALGAAIAEACRLYGTLDWTAMQRAGMRSEVGWEASAAQYAALYRSLV
ncbi:glycogen synthase GlgA [Roseobacter sp. HKCCA0434]|uniref:glycogen synthase GlgA n=1 Tax=Roseobacter sp. HKCCA0434 TaxID=3079297 RepID=UPI0029058148|nr:glycogen synthase GlgA [Roseobacter sp. HKCCA0434]